MLSFYFSVLIASLVTIISMYVRSVRGEEEEYSTDIIQEYFMTPDVYVIEEKLDRQLYGKKAADYKSDLEYYRNYDDGKRGDRYGRTPRGKTLADKRRGTRHVIKH